MGIVPESFTTILQVTTKNKFHLQPQWRRVLVFFDLLPYIGNRVDSLIGMVSHHFSNLTLLQYHDLSYIDASKNSLSIFRAGPGPTTVTLP